MKQVTRKLCWPCFFVQAVTTAAFTLAGLVAFFMVDYWLLTGLCVLAGFTISDPKLCMRSVKRED